MKISVIVPTRFGIPKKLLDSLYWQILRPDEVIEVIGSALTVQRNEGLKQATGDIILFIDDDIILEIAYINEIINTFLTHPDAMAVTGNVIVPGYTFNSFYNFIYSIFARLFLLTHRAKGRFKISGFPENYHPNITNTIKAEMLYGCNMAFRKEIFKEFSFYEDLDCRMFGEDDYFAWAITRKYAIYYNPRAVCYDWRPYPRGKQALKTRHTFINLIKRYKNRNPNIIGKIAFWWSMLGFTIFKITEAIVMKDISIIKGTFLCFKQYKNKPLEDIRKEIKIKCINLSELKN